MTRDIIILLVASMLLYGLTKVFNFLESRITDEAGGGTKTDFLFGSSILLGATFCIMLIRSIGRILIKSVILIPILLTR